MIDITTTAQKHFLKLLSRQEKDTQIRIFVNNPGTILAECRISFCPPSHVTKEDKKINFKHFCVYINSCFIPFVNGAKIDITKNKFGSQLTIKAPNIKNTYNILNQKASLEEKIKHILKFKINPQLSLHGGKVSLTKVTSDKLAILQFHGGCNGCSMAAFTVKEGIEKTLKSLLPELKGVKDFTEHKPGKHSYF